MSDTQHPHADMGKVYDKFADAFGKSVELPTWQYVGKPALNRLLASCFGTPSLTYLDMGSASARVEFDLLIPNGVQPENITGVEISPEQVAMAQLRVPGATFVVGDITTVSLPAKSFDVALSHMVFEHLDDDGLLAACKIAFDALKPGGTFAFVVTHPSKMTHIDGTLVTEYGPFTTTAPWGGELLNWRRSVDTTRAIVEAAGFSIELIEDCPFPAPAADLSADKLNEYMSSYTKYHRYPAIRLAVKATRPN